MSEAIPPLPQYAFNQAYYVGILKPLHRKRPELRLNYWILHHDSAPALKVLSGIFWPKNGLLKWTAYPVPLI
jgi:hypothetical protein